MSMRGCSFFEGCAAAAVVVLTLSLGACGPSEEEVKAAARAEEWTAIQQDYDALQQLRSELASAREAAASEEASESETDASAEDAAPSPAEELAAQVTQRADAFNERVVTFINEYAGFQGEEPLPEVKEAIHLKTGEDILLAKEYIEKGGDYAKAVEIMQSAQVVDPDNQELAAELAEAERLRYMDEERFSQVKKGMTEAEVHDVLGQVKLQNIRKYEDRNVTAWFYPREGGAAAAVFFRPSGGVLKVYDANFDAVKSAAERAE